MTPDFWLQAWQEGRTAFHQATVERELATHWPTLGVSAGGRVLVPLCGKSLDLWWLRDRGHPVVGVELAEVACRALFAEAGVEPVTTTQGPFTVWATRGLEVLQGDVLALPDAPRFDGAYDRAATVALPTPLRDRYAERMAAVLRPGAPALLVTFDHGPTDRPGPPFSVPADEVVRLYGGAFTVDRLSRVDQPELAERLGASSVATESWRLVRR